MHRFRFFSICLFAASLALGLGCRPGSEGAAGPPPARAPVVAAAERVRTEPPRVATPDGVFLVKPYIQLGDAPLPSVPERLEILWHAPDTDARWSVESRPDTGGDWREGEPPTMRRVAVRGIPPHRVWRAGVADLAPGALFDYRVLRNGTPVFAARARARKAADQPYRFVVFGDAAAGTNAQRAVAYQVHQTEPDFVFLTGDIVYPRGRISEYRRHYFPIYNAESAAPTVGAPLLRSTLFLATPGNHDIMAGNLGRYPDGMAYFLYWSQPLDGPLPSAGMRSAPPLSGPMPPRQAFLSAAGEPFPRMANFSFRYGNAHWMVLDGNYYVNWADGPLRAWLEGELARAQDATWRFVGFHQPPFSSSKTHAEYQKTRLLAPLFEKYHVDLVFSGHVHNYQRTYPMRFTPQRSASGRWEDARGRVAGTWTLDRSFDGNTQTRPDGVLYLITGAGGASLYDRRQQNQRESWQPFTHRFVSDTYSFTVVDVEGTRLTVRQLSHQGRELDRFTVTK